MKTRLLRDGMRFRAGLHGVLRGNNAAVNTDGKKAIPARCTAIGWNAKQAIDPGQRAHPVVARNARQIHIAAESAMHVSDVANRGGPRIETRVAGTATPGAQPGDPDQIVL